MPGSAGRPGTRSCSGRPAIAYVYLVYGMHDCLNVVTEPVGGPAALLIRAVEPLEGVDRHARSIGSLRAGRGRRGWTAERAARAATGWRAPGRRLAGGPGLVAAAFGIDTRWTGMDLCDPARRCASSRDPRGGAPGRRPCPPRIGIAYAGAPWTARPWRFASLAIGRYDPRRAAERPAPWTIDRSRCSSSPPSAIGWRRRHHSRRRTGWRGPGAVGRAGHRRRGARRDGPGAALIQERPGIGIGGAHDIGPPVERAGRGGRLDPAEFLAIADTLDATARLAAVLADDRRPLLRDLGHDLHPCRRCAPRSPAASIRWASCSTRHRRAWGACGRPSGSPTTGCGVAWTPWSAPELGSALQEPIVTLRNGRYVVPVKAEARSRVKGIVHDASGSGQTLFIEPLVAVELGQRLARGDRRGSRRRSPGSSTSCRRSSRSTGRRCATRSMRWPRSTCGRQGGARRRDGRRRAPRPRAAGGGPPVGAPPWPDRAGRPHRHPPRRRLHGAGRDRPEHGRQDGDPAHAGPAEPDAPGRPPRPGRGGQQPADLARRLRRHRRRAIGRPVAVHVLRVTCARSPGSSRRPVRARSSSSTSSAPARTRPRARRSPRRSSTTSSRPAPSSPPRPTTPSSRPTPTRPKAPAMPRSSSTSRRCRRRTASRSACPAAARRSRSRSASGSLRRSSRTPSPA